MSIPIKEALLRISYTAGAVAVGAYLAGIALFFVLRLVIGDRHWAVSFLNNSAVYLLLPLLICFPLALALRIKPLWICALVLLLVCVAWIGPHYLPRRPVRPVGPTIRIVTFNMSGGNQEKDRLTEWLPRTDADVIFLQEVPDSYVNQHFPQLRALYPYQYREETPQRWWSNGVLSKYPIEAVTVLDPRETFASSRQRMEITVRGQTIALYSIHLTYTLRDARIRTSSPLIRAISRFDDSTRNAEIDALLVEIEDEHGPFVVAGDFNMTPQALTYGKLPVRMADSFREAGYGLGGTWPISENSGFPAFIPPLMRIDYIWHSEHFRAIHAWVGPRLGSDHLPVLAVLELAP